MFAYGVFKRNHTFTVRMTKNTEKTEQLSGTGEEEQGKRKMSPFGQKPCSFHRSLLYDTKSVKIIVPAELYPLNLSH
jgi:hypothetical protein